MHSEQHAPLDMKQALGIPLLLMVLLLVFEPSQLDLALTDLLYVPGKGFIGEHSWFLENILHDWAKVAVIVVGIGALAGAIIGTIPAGKKLGVVIKPKRWLFVFVAMALSTGIVMPLKRATEMQCPWSLDRYGGVEHYSALTDTRAAPVEKPGKCWPGGHASSGFCLFALFFALRDIRPRAARAALITALGLGITFSLGRMLQGAHFLSHNLWTALIDWTISATLYRLLLYPASRKACKDAPVSARMATPCDA